MNKTDYRKHSHKKECRIQNDATERPHISDESCEQRMQLFKETLQKRLDAYWSLKRLCDALEQNLNTQCQDLYRKSFYGNCEEHDE